MQTEQGQPIVKWFDEMFMSRLDYLSQISKSDFALKNLKEIDQFMDAHFKHNQSETLINLRIKIFFVRVKHLQIQGRHVEALIHCYDIQHSSNCKHTEEYANNIDEINHLIGAIERKFNSLDAWQVLQLPSNGSSFDAIDRSYNDLVRLLGVQSGDNRISAANLPPEVVRLRQKLLNRLTGAYEMLISKRRTRVAGNKYCCCSCCCWESNFNIRSPLVYKRRLGGG